MKRRQLLVGGSTLLTATVAGCVGSAQTSDDTSRTITVTNAGEVSAEPDLAILRVSVESTDDSASAVRDELAERSDRLYQGLVDAGIPDDRITTAGFDIRERLDRRRADAAEVDPRSEAAEEFRYYEGVHAYRVEITDVESVGETVDAAINAGADSTGRIEYTLSEDRRTELREQALQSALAAAREEGSFISDEVDASIVDVQTVDTSDERVSPVYREVAEDSTAGSAATDLEPGDVTVRATTTVTYTIN